jgi:hypothetical protein
MKSKAAIGQECLSGDVVAILPHEGKNRSVRVRVRCFCGTLFVARYSPVRLGVRKSCKHLRDENFARMRRELLEELSAEERLGLFNLVQEFGRYGAAKRTGRTKLQAGLAWLNECRRLDQMPLARRVEIWEVARRRSVYKATELFGLSRSEVARIGYVLSKETVFEQPLLSKNDVLRIALGRAIELGLALDPQTPECNELLETMDVAIGAALDRLKLGSRLRGTYAKEFNKGEFGTPQRSRFGWLYAAMRSMDNANIKICFGENGVKFMRTCELTDWRRLLRRECFLSAWKANMSLASKTSTDSSIEAVRPSPRPIVSPEHRLIAMKRIAKPSYEPQVIGLTIDYCCALLKDAA